MIFGAEKSKTIQLTNSDMFVFSKQAYLYQFSRKYGLSLSRIFITRAIKKNPVSLFFTPCIQLIISFSDIDIIHGEDIF